LIKSKPDDKGFKFFLSLASDGDVGVTAKLISGTFPTLNSAKYVNTFVPKLVAPIYVDGEFDKLSDDMYKSLVVPIGFKISASVPINQDSEGPV